jgi:alkylhydroperoxidase family enzyme
MRIEPIPFDDLDPELRARYEAGAASGMYSMTTPLQIFAYAKAQAIAADEQYKRTFKQGLLGPRMEELIRISSAQYNGCGPCSSSRKDDSISDADVACMLTDLDDPTYTERERRALRFVYLMCTDHHAIDDEIMRSLGEVFTIAEIVELGMITGRFIGSHRWMHVLDVLSPDEPVLRYDPAQVNARRPAVGTATTSA